MLTNNSRCAIIYKSIETKETQQKQLKNNFCFIFGIEYTIIRKPTGCWGMVVGGRLFLGRLACLGEKNVFFQKTRKSEKKIKKWLTNKRGYDIL